MSRELPSRFDPQAERVRFGRSRREVVSRIAQGHFAPSRRRPDVADILKEAEKGRVAALLPIKYGRMAASPFGFFRGAAPVMAFDLSRLPATGLTVQLCGDAHVRNLGAYAAPDGHVVFDINDFDESTAGPWEWDLKRLAVSLVLAGREAQNPDRRSRDAVRDFSRSFRESLREFAAMPAVELARFEIRRYLDDGPVHQVLKKAQRATPRGLLAKLTAGRGSSPRRFRSEPPLLSRVPESTAKRVLGSLGKYRESLNAGRRLIFDTYKPADVAFKVVGTGSVGTRDYTLLAFGNGAADPLFLQVKEELPSCYAPYLAAARRETHQGRRVAEGQERTQTVVDPFLGWTDFGGRQYLVRQLSDHKASLDPEELEGDALVEYALVCGEVFARAHARTGDAAALSAYCGASEKLDNALAGFAAAYADQTTMDYERFLKAIRAGLFSARRPPRRR